MSGVRSGTRLEQLEQLQRVARLRRAQARWNHDHNTEARLDQLVRRIGTEMDRERRARPEVATAVRAADQRVAERLTALGVTAYAVKVWAHTEGLIPHVVKGRVSPALVDAYAHAHQQQETTP